ncbi:putative WW domain-containing protein [Plasmopara halstedii]
MDTTSLEFQEALRDHARSLGVKLDSEIYLLPLVQEALLAELPPDWEQGETEDGTLYYFNSTTEESIWEHPLDAHYRELIQSQKEEHAATLIANISEAPEDSKTIDVKTSLKTTLITSNRDVYSFDDISDEETPTPIVSAVVSIKSKSNNLFTKPHLSAPALNNSSSNFGSLTRDMQEQPQSTLAGFGRDRSWLLDSDDDVAPNAIRRKSIEQKTTPHSSIDASESTHLAPVSQRLDHADSSSYTPSSISIDASNPVTANEPSIHDSEISSRWCNPTESVASTPSPSAAMIQQFEKDLTAAMTALECERVAHSETTRNLEIAQQEARESTYLKMKVKELKSKLAEQETAASEREKQQLNTSNEIKSSALACEKQQEKQIAALEAENARLMQLQGCNQNQQRESNEKETSSNRSLLELKEAEVECLQKRLTEQEHHMTRALESYEKCQTELQLKLNEQTTAAEVANCQHVDEMAALRTEMEKLTSQCRETIEEQITKYAQLEQETYNLNNEFNSKSGELESLKRDYHTSKSDYATKCEQVETMQKAMKKEQEWVSELEETNRMLETKVDSLEREKIATKKKLDASNEHVEAKVVELDSLKLLLNKTQEEVQKLQTALQKSQDDNQRINDRFEEQKYQYQLILEKERVQSEAEAQAQSRFQKLQTQLNMQLDEQTTKSVKLQSEVLTLQTTLTTVELQQVKPLEKRCDQLQCEVRNYLERSTSLDKKVFTTTQEMSKQTDRVSQLETELDVLVRREQERKEQVETLCKAKEMIEKQLTLVQDELVTVQHDKRVDVDRLTFEVRDLENQIKQKEYEAVYLKEQFTKAETWRRKEVARVEKRDIQLMELQEKIAALQAHQIEIENSTEIKELRLTKQQLELKIQKFEAELHDERDAHKHDNLRRTEELQRMQQTLEWQLPQLAQICVTRSSDEWAQKCRAVAKKVRTDLNFCALQERNELITRERHAYEAYERIELKLKTSITENEFYRREVGRLEDNNKILLEQLHTIRLYLTQRTIPSVPPPLNVKPLSVPSNTSINLSDMGTVNHLNTQLGILHSHFQQLLDVNDRQKSTSFSSNDRFEFPDSPTASKDEISVNCKKFTSSNDQMKQKDEKNMKIEQLAINAVMEEKLRNSKVYSMSSTFQEQQKELLTSLESLGTSKSRCFSFFQDSNSHGNEEKEHNDELSSTLWYQQDYWRRKYQ